MTPEHVNEVAAILADANKPDADAKAIWARASNLGQRLSGDDRDKLVDGLYALFGRSTSRP
jgi:hypothetical protein